MPLLLLLLFKILNRLQQALHCVLNLLAWVCDVDPNELRTITMVVSPGINDQSAILPDEFCVKSGIEAYEVGKGNPKMSKADKDNRIYHSKQKLDDTYLPYLDGENVNRYLLTWNGEYVKYGPNLAAMRDPALFRGPRILVRQIPEKSVYSIDATFTDKKIINDRNSMIITKIQGIPILTLLGIVNSKLITLWFLMKFDKFQRRLFPQFKVNELAQFPIPPLNDKDKVDAIAELVKVIMDKKKKQEDVDEENNRVDELVMDLFRLSEADKQSIRNFTF